VWLCRMRERDSRRRIRRGSGQGGGNVLFFVEFFEVGQSGIDEVGVGPGGVPSLGEPVQEQRLRESSHLFRCTLRAKGQQLCLKKIRVSDREEIYYYSPSRSRVLSPHAEYSHLPTPDGFASHSRSLGAEFGWRSLRQRGCSCWWCW
jgi:hypothetical protein